MTDPDLRADHRLVELVHTDELSWQPSPSPSVWRKRLERRGPAEAGRVTSIVRYDPGSQFHSHPHPDGEEILVLEGIFSDEHGSYPAGTHLLNPEGFSHAPFSEGGCLLFVKLRQFAGPDRPQQAQRLEDGWQPGPYPGVEVSPLYSQSGYPETIRAVRIRAGAHVPEQVFPGGEEIFVIAGSFSDERGAHRAGSWLRYPPGASHTPSTTEGCILYVKKGHLDPGGQPQLSV